MSVWGKIWQGISFVLIGIVIGIIAVLKWIAPPGDDFEIKFGKVKIKVRGKNNQVTDGVDVTPNIHVVKEEKSKKEKRKEERRLKKENR